MDYSDALQRLLRLVDNERINSTVRTRVRYDLRRMEALLKALDNPHEDVPTIHIAGTKGKGSTAAMCSSVLSHGGFRTGLYTSPHLHSFRERISLDGAPLSGETFAALVEEVWPSVEQVTREAGLGEVTMFETLTAMAFKCFQRMADIQVLEVGLGGRLDTTNLVGPPGLKVCAITSLSLDHTSVLGNDLASIASEKAGIIKSGVPVVTSPQAPEAMAVIESVCLEKDVRLIRVGTDLTWEASQQGPRAQEFQLTGRLGTYQLSMPLLGSFQLENAATAVGVLEVLNETGFRVSHRALEEGFRKVSWPCRMEVLSEAPLVVCDGAHNPYSVAQLGQSLPAYFDFRRVILVTGLSKDKDIANLVEELVPLCESRGPDKDEYLQERRDARVIVTSSRHPRAADTVALADHFSRRGIETTQAQDVKQAMELALSEAEEGDLVLATGSLFVAAEAREHMKGIEPELYPELREDLYPTAR